MKLEEAIKNKFPESGALKFCVWDEDNHLLFNSEEYENDIYSKRLLQCEVTSLCVTYGPYCGGASLEISIETGARERRELWNAALKIQQYCEKTKCDVGPCPFWRNGCALEFECPTDWQLKQPAEESIS